MDRYAIKFSRGAKTHLPFHPAHSSLRDLRRYSRTLHRPLAIDLFCGAGGLSLGLEQAGFNVILGVDHKADAVETHAANFGGASELADLSNPLAIERLIQRIGKLRIDLVAGGPPCQPFSRAGDNKIKSLVRNGDRLFQDDRRQLWHGFMTFVSRLRPSAVLVENVPDMAIGSNASEYEGILLKLEELGYTVHTRILRASDFGVPQLRERLFIVGLSVNRPFQWPILDETGVNLRDAIGDLPPVEGGDITDPKQYGHPISAFQVRSRSRVNNGDTNLVYDHLTREVRLDDQIAFSMLRPGENYTDLPKYLRRYRSDTFDDKYHRLDWTAVSRTITAHIAKDGYWYIHPEQNRTLTVREAARIQTFPDWFRFAGFRTNTFKQVGDAVPPALGEAIGRSIRSSLRRWGRVPTPPKPEQIIDLTKQWCIGDPSIRRKDGGRSSVGMVRLATRLFGENELVQAGKSRQMRLCLTRAIAGNGDIEVFEGIRDISTRFCKKTTPDCRHCPLNRICISGLAVCGSEPRISKRRGIIEPSSILSNTNGLEGTPNIVEPLAHTPALPGQASHS